MTAPRVRALYLSDTIGNCPNGHPDCLSPDCYLLPTELEQELVKARKRLSAETERLQGVVAELERAYEEGKTMREVRADRLRREREAGPEEGDADEQVH